ncbi:MAG: ABC transporter substrate-binding protein [Thermodesulfobacteriota bacterium]
MRCAIQRILFPITVVLLLLFGPFITFGAEPPLKRLDTLSVGLAESGELTTLDPARAVTAAPIIVTWHLYTRLLDIRTDGTLAPMLATQWTHSQNLRQWTFKLRPDAFFHTNNGKLAREITSKDVKFSIERAVKLPGLGRSLLAGLVRGLVEFIEGRSPHISGIIATEGKLVINLTKPFAFLPERLAASPFGIVPMGTPDDPKSPPVGSGPYFLVSWKLASNRVDLSLNKHYWAIGELAPRHLIFYTFNNTAAAVQELKANTIQWLGGGASALDLLRGNNPGIRVHADLGLDIKLLVINQTKTLLDRRQRQILGQALNMATDRSKLVDFFGGGRKIAGPVPLPYWDSYGYAFDLEKAQKLLSFLPRERRKLHVLVQPGTDNKQLAQLLATQWETAGVSVTLEQGQVDFVSRVVGGKYQTALVYYGPFLPVPEQYLWLYEAEARPAPNVEGYKSASFEKALIGYLTTPPGVPGEHHLHQAIQILLEDAPVVWLVQTPRIIATRLTVRVPFIAGMPVFWACSARR